MNTLYYLTKYSSKRSMELWKLLTAVISFKRGCCHSNFISLAFYNTKIANLENRMNKLKQRGRW